MGNSIGNVYIHTVYLSSEEKLKLESNLLNKLDIHTHTERERVNKYGPSIARIDHG